MTRTIFIDVGAHVGETAEEAVLPKWNFDRVYAFEPASRNVKVIREIPAENLTIIPAGWWRENTFMDLHDPGEIGASIHAAKRRTGAVERCEFLNAAEWMATHTDSDDEIWLKLNCEGSECEIIEALRVGGVLDRVSHLLVHFDVEKIPGLGAEAETARDTLRRHRVEFLEADQIMFGRSHRAKTANWLAWTQGNRIIKFIRRHPVKWGFRVRQLMYPLKVRWVRGGT